MAKDNTREICAEIIRRLAQERKRQRVSMNLLASKAGLTQPLISMLEGDGVGRNPTVGTLLRIANALGVDLGDIITKAKKRIQSKVRTD